MNPLVNLSAAFHHEWRAEVRPARGAMHAMDNIDSALRTEARVRSVREDHRTRTDYLFQTKTAARAVGITNNKFADRWRRTRHFLTELYIDQPGETAAELMAIVANAEAERLRRSHITSRRTPDA